MAEVLKADLDAIRSLADKQRGHADEIRAISIAQAMQVTEALTGSDTATACAQAAEKAKAALAEVAGRVTALADANRNAANTIGESDDAYASSIAKLNTAH